MWNHKNEVLHKIIAHLVFDMQLLELRLAAILKIAIYERSGGRPLRRPGEIEIVWYKLYVGQIWCF